MMRHLFLFVLLCAACVDLGAPPASLPSALEGLAVGAGEVAVGDGAEGLVGDEGLRFEVASGTCGGVACPRPRLSIGAVTAPQSPLGIRADPVNGLLETDFAPTGSWQRSINGWTINGASASTPLTPHVNLGAHTRGFEIQGPTASAPGAYPLLKLRGTALGRTAPTLEIRRAPEQTGPLLRAYAGAQLANGVDTGPQTPLFAVTREGALYLGTQEPETPPLGLVALWGCEGALCLKDASGAVLRLAGEAP